MRKLPYPRRPAGLILLCALGVDHLVKFVRVREVTGYLLARQLVGSVALGFLVGLLLASWASQVVESGEVLILIVGCVLLTAGWRPDLASGAREVKGTAGVSAWVCSAGDR